MPASLTSVSEVMSLAGVRNITLSPGLLDELAETPAEEWRDSIIVGSSLKLASAPALAVESMLEGTFDDENAWRLAFTRAENGRSEIKLVKVLNLFCNVQSNLENMVNQFCELESP